MSFQRARERYEQSIRREKPIDALLGAFVNGVFTTRVADDPSLTYARFLDNTPTTAKHRNKVNLDIAEQNVAISLYYDEYDQLAIWDLEPTQAGATLSSIPDIYISGPTTLNGLTDVTLTAPTSGDTLVFDGTAWVNGTPTSGGTGYPHWVPDHPPVTSSALDDEFAGATFNTTLWTAWNPTIGTLAMTMTRLGVRLAMSSTPPYELFGFYQAVSDPAYTLTAKVFANHQITLGLALFEDATNAAANVLVHNISYYSNNVQEWTDYATLPGGSLSVVDTYQNFGYLRVRFDGSTFFFDYSADGNSWVEVVSETPAYTVLQVGIAMFGTDTVSIGHVRFFRYQDSLADFNDPVFGAEVS